MKILNFGAEAVAQNLLPVMTPKSGDPKASSRASSADLSSIDPQDPQSFSRLLQSDHGSDRLSGSENGGVSKKSGLSDRSSGSINGGSSVAAKGNASAKLDARAGARADKVSSGGASASARDTQDVVASGDSFASVGSGSAQSAKDADKQAASDGVLSSDAQTLPPDPRLNQTPEEIALEAAAIAAAQLLVGAPAPQAPQVSAATAEVSDSGAAPQGQGGQSGGNNGAAFFDPLAIRALQSSFRPSIATPLVSAQPTLGTESASNASQNVATGAPQLGSGAVTELAAVAAPLAAASLIAPAVANSDTASVSGVAPAQADALTPLSLGASLVSLSATSAQVATIAAAGKQLGAASTASSQAVPVKGAVDLLSSEVLNLNQFAAASSAAQVKTSGEIFASQPDTATPQGVSKPDAGKIDSGTVTQSVALGAGQVVSTKGDASGNGASNSPSDQNSKNSAKDAAPVIPVKVSQGVNSRVSAPVSKAVGSSGTLDANEKAVSKDSTALSVATLEETAPVKTQESVLSAVVGRGSLAQVPAPVVGGARALSEIDSKPTVLPPVSVKGNEVWKVVTDALQRARSENPSHLAVEVRMDDGSTLGLEVRMSSTGLHASFRSESQTLLKNLEAQWSGFVTKESPDAKVTAAVFEGRSSFGNSAESNTNGGERRQQMEDAASSAALSRGSLSGKSEQSAPTVPKQITPSIRTRDGRMAVYA